MQAFAKRCGSNIKDYIVKMARGEHSLSRAFWANYVLANLLSCALFTTALCLILSKALPNEAMMAVSAQMTADPYVAIKLLKTNLWAYIAVTLAILILSIYTIFSSLAWFRSVTKFEGNKFWVYLSYTLLAFETVHFVHSNYFLIKFVL